jgi:LmbE family N-acetylglucosaminyl deacetylase
VVRPAGAASASAGGGRAAAPLEVLEEVPARALAVYAHPDDPEVSCGGTLSRWSAGGSEVHAVVATRGDKGSLDPGSDPDDLAERRALEVAEAAAVLGLAGVEQLGHPDGELEVVTGLRAQLVEIVRRLRPDVVVSPDPTAVFFGDGYVNHGDHRAIGWAALDAVAPAAYSPLYHPDAGPPHGVATMLLTATLEPDTWVDVEPSLETKVAALLCHRTQLAPDAERWLPDFVRARAEEEGRRAGIRYAKSFRRLRLRR